MLFAGRTALLRLVAMVGLVASGVLTMDSLHPERAFCPLEEACAAARESALGTIAGIPTTSLGLLAFAGLFALSLLPEAWRRQVLRPTGVLAGVSGLGFVLFQAVALDAFCPLCLVADAAAMAASVIAVTWPPAPYYLTPGQAIPETSRARAAWTLGLMAAAFLTFAWPRPTAPAWVEITPLDAAALELAFEDEPAEPTTSPDPGPEAEPVDAPDEPEVGAPEELPGPASSPSPVVSASLNVSAHPTPAEPPASSEPSPTESRPAAAAPPEFPAPAPPPEVRIVEYLNAYCTHCRATHKNLEHVLDQTDANVRVRRVYTWASKDVPLWARACAHAADQGLEDRMFAELLHARSQTVAEVYAAAGRAGVDQRKLRAALRGRAVPPRIAQDRKLMQAARLKGLPTLDIGRRRLMGEQSASELTAAIQAAASIEAAP